MTGKYRDDPMTSELCGWGRCTERTDGYPLCERHLRKAWAVIEVRRREEAEHVNGRT